MEQRNSPVSDNSVAKLNNTKIENQRRAINGLKNSLSRHQIEVDRLTQQLEVAKRNEQKLKEKLSKLQQLLASNIFQSDPKNEDLMNLLNLDIFDLFSKYEK